MILVWLTFASSIDPRIKYLFNPSEISDTNFKNEFKCKNAVQLVGIVGNDVLLTNFENGNKKASCILATNEVYTNAKGEK